MGVGRNFLIPSRRASAVSRDGQALAEPAPVADRVVSEPLPDAVDGAFHVPPPERARIGEVRRVRLLRRDVARRADPDQPPRRAVDLFLDQPGAAR